MQPHTQPKKTKIASEFLAGLAATAIGGYNLAAQLRLIDAPFEVPQMIGNLMLIIAGLLLLWTAFKLWRYKWHTSRLF